jgi:hypothetical protein
MNVYEFVLAIIVILTIGRVIERKIGGGRRSRRSRHDRKEEATVARDSESLDKMRSLEERIKVLERIITDQRYELREKFREIE